MRIPFWFPKKCRKLCKHLAGLEIVSPPWPQQQAQVSVVAALPPNYAVCPSKSMPQFETCWQASSHIWVREKFTYRQTDGHKIMPKKCKSKSRYSNFRKYATAPDEKRCMIMESCSCFLWEFFWCLSCLSLLNLGVNWCPRKNGFPIGKK